MKKVISLIKACMTENMNLFKTNNKKQSKISKKVFPAILVLMFFGYIFSFASGIIQFLSEDNLQYVVLTLFIGVTTILTIIEGIYKSSNLLFNCKDDNLLLSLPVKRLTILFIRIFKYYVFELLYNSIFLVPAMFAYSVYVKVDITYYIVSFIAILLLPIIPIVISCIIGGISSAFSSKFRFKNIAQIIITTAMLLIIFFGSSNMQNLMGTIAENATNINNIICSNYYPANAYIKLITEFNVKELLVFIMVHLFILIFSIAFLSKIYFRTNSQVKTVRTKSKKSNYKIIVNNPIKSIIKKEFKRFINSPVFVINSAFGLVLFMVGCIFGAFKFEETANSMLGKDISVFINDVNLYIPVILFGFICFASLLSSISSSMISLEGKSFEILKSLPIKPITIIKGKILTAVLIMLPFILIGDVIIFITFKFSLIKIIEILIASIILPLVSGTIGLIINLKHPKMNAENDAEVVKHSMSSFLAVSIGLILAMITLFVMLVFASIKFSVDLILLVGIGIYFVLYLILLLYLNKKGVKRFNDISV